MDRRKFDWDQAVRDYESGMPMERVAAKHNVTPAAIKRVLDKRGVKIRTNGDYRGKREPLIRMLLEGRRPKDIAAELNTPQTNLNSLLRRSGMRSPVSGVETLRRLTHVQLATYFVALDEDRLPHQDALAFALGKEIEYRDPARPAKATNPRPTLWTSEDIETLRTMLNDGETHDNIAHRLGRSRMAVSIKVTKMGWSDKERGRVNSIAAVKGRARPLGERIRISKSIKANKREITKRRRRMRELKQQTHERATQTLRKNVRGCVVPPERESEYKAYQKRGFRCAEIRKIMGL